MIDSNKIGKFSIEADAFNQHPDVVRTIMGECIILRAEMLLHMKAVEYVAIVEDFDEIEPGEQAPFYDLEFDPDAEKKVTWARRA